MTTDITTGVRVLFAGQYWPGANSMYIARAFERCGAVVRLLSDTAIFPEWNGFRGKVARRLLHNIVIEDEWNRQLLELVDGFQPDLVYITAADFCRKNTLLEIRRRGIPLICFYHDVKWERERGNRFAKTISLYDLVATTRRWQGSEFKRAGAKEVKVIRFGYEPLAHRPVHPAPLAVERYGADIVFIGTYEPHRAAELEELIADDFPYNFRLWGFWNKLPESSLLRSYWQGRLIHEQEIPVIYATAKVALHFLAWEPRGNDEALKKGDQHNSRTFQITACGGAIMLAQRTLDHQRFFEENVEAVFFDDLHELKEKILFWLDPRQDVARRLMAARARERCLRENYTYTPVARQLLEFFALPVIDSSNQNDSRESSSAAQDQDETR